MHQEGSEGYRATLKPRPAAAGCVKRTHPEARRSPLFVESRRACALWWNLDEKLRRKGRLNIDGSEAADAIARGRLAPHASDRSRYVARRGRLVVVFSAPAPCNNYCITAYYERA
jgi:hypothetical protein